MRLHAAMIFALLQGVVAPAVAQTWAAPRGGSTDADDYEFWREVREPGHRRARRLLDHAMRVLETRTAGPAERRAVLEAAIRRLQRAHRLAPRDPDVLFLLARITAQWEHRTPGGDTERMDDEALEHYQQLRRLQPGYEASAVGFDLGIIHTRARRFDQAIAEYERAIAAVTMLEASQLNGGEGAYTMYSNLAEVTMLAGDVRGAVEHFQRSVDLSRRTGDQMAVDFDGDGAADEMLWVGVLPLWGLAVSLDRLGEHRTALEHAERALSQDQGEMRILTASNIFFEPAHELHWYEALGHEARAGSGDAARREASLRSAAASWRRFLDQGGSRSRWSEQASEHLERIEREIGTEAASRRPTPRRRGRRPPPERSPE